MVAPVAVDRGCRGLRSRPLPHQGGELGFGNFFPGSGRLGGRHGGRPWFHSVRISPVYLECLWALFSGVKRRMGGALVSSKVLPSALSGALPWSSSGTPAFGPMPLRRYWLLPSHQIQWCVWSLRKGCRTLVPCWNSGYVLCCGGACGGREDDEDAWSEWAGGFGGGFARLGGEAQGGCGGWEAVALPSTVAFWELKAGLPLFLRARFGGTGGGTGKAWAWKKGWVTC